MMQPRELNSELRLADSAKAVQNENLLSTVLPLEKEHAFKLGHLHSISNM